MGFLGSRKLPNHQGTVCSQCHYYTSTQKTPSQVDWDAEVIPAEKRFKTAVASMQGLFPHFNVGLEI